MAWAGEGCLWPAHSLLLVPPQQQARAGLRKTNRALVIHEDKVFGGFGGELVSTIMHHCFEDLDAPVERMGQSYHPVPFNKELEAAMQVNPDLVLEKIRETVSY